MPPQNNVKTTLHPEILLPAKQSVSSRLWNQCCTRSSAVPLSTSSQLLLLPRKGSEATRGFGLVAHEHGRCHAYMERDGSSSTPAAGAEVQQGPGQPAAPATVPAEQKSLWQSRQTRASRHPCGGQNSLEFSARLSSQGGRGNKKELKCKAST